MTGHTTGDPTRVRVLDAALETFARGGLAALTVQEIRDSSDVSVGSLYHHFGNRDATGRAGSRPRSRGRHRAPPAPYYGLVVIGPVAETARRWLAGAEIDLAEARTVLASTIWRALTYDPS